MFIAKYIARASPSAFGISPDGGDIVPSNATGFVVSSWGPVVFVLNEIEELKLYVHPSGEISQYQREGLADSNQNGSKKETLPQEGAGPLAGRG